MATFYVNTTGLTTNSGSTDTDSPSLSGAAATVAGSVVSLDGAPDLSGVIITPGPTQSTIQINDATNSNTKIFKITAVDDTAKTVTVGVAPTGVTSSVWAIGGRFVWTPARIEAAISAGDIVEIGNDIVTSAGTILTARNSSTNVLGFIIFKGKTGVRPIIQTSGSGTPTIQLASQAGWRISNLEIRQTHASSGPAVHIQAPGCLIENCKITDAGGHGVQTSGTGWRVINCEISGTVADGINATASGAAIGNYIHDVGGDGFQNSQAGTSMIAIFNIIDTAAARGIYTSGAHTDLSASNIIFGNTIYNCGDSGFEAADSDTVTTLINNIFQDNGNAAGESNVEWAAGTAELFGYHSHNILHDNTGADASTAFITLGATESTADPLMAAPATGDFTLQDGSPAKSAGWPGLFLGGPTGYLDMGAVQRVEPAPGGGSGTPHILGG